jgi:hypothetical protein
MYTPTELTKNCAMYNEILKDRMEAATLLSEKLKVQNSNWLFWLYLEEVYRGYEIAKLTTSLRCCSF